MWLLSQVDQFNIGYYDITMKTEEITNFTFNTGHNHIINPITCHAFIYQTHCQLLLAIKTVNQITHTTTPN